MHRGLVALSASAVAAMYMAGYLRTQSADASIGAAAPPTQSLSAVPPTPNPTRTPAPIPQSAALKDGTYTGQGSSRRGDVWVSVDVTSGRIASVTITRSTLQYPLRDIAGLPAQVVQRQSAQIDIVSRATYSSQAFRTAVSQALSKAA
jgi:uncharacterized protein with FMN-binding domain